MKLVNKIPIVMVSDKNYIIQTRVAIWSMRKSTNAETGLKIMILCSETLEKKFRQEILDLQAILSNLEIEFYEVDETVFSGAKMTGHIPIASYYRLVIGEICEEEKCLFLDGDMIINVDLNQIFSLEMEEDYIAGVREFGFLVNLDKAQKHMYSFGFPTLDFYVNAGVMVFNLRKIREDKLQDIFLQEIKAQYTYMDQDIINKVCLRKIKLLDGKYNVPACHIRPAKLAECLKVPIKQIKNEWKILHFIGGYKPWNNVRTWGARVWWRYAKEALAEDTWEKLYSDAVQMTNKSDWTYILKKSTSEKEIVIVGYTSIARDVYESLIRCGIKSKFCFCDNSKEKQGLSSEGVMVYPVIDMIKMCPEALWLNTSQVSYGEINRQLIELGINEDRIVVYQHKSELYYEMLDESYDAYEREQLRIKRRGV